MRDVLLISQDERFLQSIKRYLEGHGDFNVTTETDLNKAMEIINWTDFDAIGCDHSSTMDGIGLVRSLRENMISTPFILIYDGSLGENMVSHGLESGADHIFKKMAITSMNADSLLRMLEIAIESHTQLLVSMGMAEHYRQLVDNANALIVMIDRQGRVKFCNRTALEFLGFPSDELFGRPAIGRIFPLQTGDGRDARLRLDDRLKEARPDEDITEVIREDGSRCQVAWRHSVVEDGDGPNLLSVGIPVMSGIAPLEPDDPKGVLDGMREALVSLDRDLRFTFLNAYAERILKRKREDLIGRSWLVEFPAVRNTDVEKLVRTALNDGKSSSLELLFKTDRINEWFNIRAYPHSNGVNLFFSTVSEKKNVEEELRRSKERYRDVVDHMFEGTIVLDEKANVVLMNQKMADIFGLKIEQVQGKNLDIQIPPSDLKFFTAAFERNKKGESELIEYTFNRKDGRILQLVINVSPNFDEKGIFKGAVAFVNDATNQRKEHERLQLQSKVLNQVKTAVIVVGPDQKIIYWNPYAEKMYGWKMEETRGRNIVEVLDVEISGPALLAESDSLSKNGKAERETWHTCKDGTKIMVGTSMSVVIDDREQPIGIVMLCTDITERNTIEKQLRQANQRLSLVSSITRHDLINQLTILSGYLQMAQDVGKGTTSENILKKAVDTSRTIHELVDFTKDYESLGTNEQLWIRAERMFKDARAKLDMKDVQVDCGLRDLIVLTDPMLEKVFYNLMENSLRHGGNVTHIEISYQDSDEGIVIIYKDDGKGITMARKHAILDDRSSRHGMRLSKEILSFNGMSIKENGRYGEGVRFEVTVPAGRYRIADRSF